MSVRWVALALVVLCSAATASAEEPVDLSPYLGVVPQVGDFRSYRTGSGDLTEIVVAVEPWKKGWSIEYRIAENHMPLFSIHQSVAGGRLWVDSVGYMPSYRRPRPWARLSAALPSVLPRLGVRIQLQGSGRTLFEHRSKATVVGFETIDTPAGAHPAALRVESMEDSWTQEGFGLLHTTQRRVSWYAAGIGRVASAPDETGVPDEWLVAAHIDDVTFP